jgi:hypothetical protein
MKIKTAAGQVYTVNVEDSWTVKDLNEAIVDLVHIPADKQNIQYNGQTLCTSRNVPLSEYGIANDTEVMLMGKLKGGTHNNINGFYVKSLTNATT